MSYGVTSHLAVRGLEVSNTLPALPEESHVESNEIRLRTSRERNKDEAVEAKLSVWLLQHEETICQGWVVKRREDIWLYSYMRTIYCPMVDLVACHHISMICRLVLRKTRTVQFVV